MICTDFSGKDSIPGKPASPSRQTRYIRSGAVLNSIGSGCFPLVVKDCCLSHHGSFCQAGRFWLWLWLWLSSLSLSLSSWSRCEQQLHILWWHQQLQADEDRTQAGSVSQYFHQIQWCHDVPWADWSECLNATSWDIPCSQGQCFEFQKGGSCWQETCYQGSLGWLLRKVQVDQGLTISGALYTSMFRLAYLSSNVSWTMLTYADICRSSCVGLTRAYLINQARFLHLCEVSTIHSWNMLEYVGICWNMLE